MAKKLYVGGLSYNTTQQVLQDTFAKAGQVTSATIIIDRMTGRSKGFGFVEMANDSEAQAAIDMFNGKDLDGRALTVNEARPMEERPRRENRYWVSRIHFDESARLCRHIGTKHRQNTKQPDIRRAVLLSAHLKNRLFLRPLTTSPLFNIITSLTYFLHNFQVILGCRY